MIVIKKGFLRTPVPLPTVDTLLLLLLILSRASVFHIPRSDLPDFKNGANENYYYKDSAL
jgi:hypothetical protein